MFVDAASTSSGKSRYAANSGRGSPAEPDPGKIPWTGVARANDRGQCVGKQGLVVFTQLVRHLLAGYSVAVVAGEHLKR